MENKQLKDEFIEKLKMSSIFSLGFNLSEIETLIDNRYFKKISGGRKIALEGDLPKSIIIPLNTEIHLISEKQKKGFKVGTVGNGRVFNLYSVLRKINYQYSGMTTEDGWVLEIPIEEFEQFLDRYPKQKSYLKQMTGSAAIRKLASHFDAVGCPSMLKVDFMSRLVFDKLEPQVVLLDQGDYPQFAFVAIQGQIQAFKSTKDQLTPLWLVPNEVWISLSDAINEKKSTVAYRTVSSTEIYRIGLDDLKELQNTYSLDLNAFLEWMNGVLTKQQLQTKNLNEKSDNDNESEPDLEELFKVNHPTAKKPWQSYPFIAQNDQMDCGPACMAMIAKYYGKNTNIQFWRSHLATDREGTSLFDLARVGEKFGFICHGMLVDDIKEIDKKMLPAIVYKEYHYLVLYEVTKTHYVIGDPGIGLRKILHTDFEEGFSNVVLFLKPTEKFDQLKNQASKYSHYWNLLSGFEREISFALICSFLGVVLSLIPPFLNQYLFDEVLVNKDLSGLKLAVIAIFSVSLLETFSRWARGAYLQYFFAKFDFKSKSAFIRKMMTLPYSFFMVRHTGDFTRRIAEMEKIRHFLANTLMRTFLDMLSVSLGLFIVYMYSFKLGMLITALCPGFLFISMLFSHKLESTASEFFNQSAKAEGFLTDLVKGLPAIKTTTSEMAARWRYESKLTQSIRNLSSFSILSNHLTALTEGYLQFSKYSVVGFSISLCIKGEITIGQSIAIAAIVNQILIPFFHLGIIWPEIQEIRVTLNRLNDIFLAPSEQVEAKNQISKSLKGEIEFRDVWFRYGGESTDWVLEGVSFKIEPGHHVAIVGPSGSGKSTIAALLGRLFEPTKGQIFIDGRDYREYDLNWLRNHIGLVLQDARLFQGTIIENIAFSEIEPVMENVFKAAQISASEGFINKKFANFDYYIGSDGLGLSGGEKQRLALARTLYQKPNILVLDEATSALDGIAEINLLNNLKNHKDKLTVVSIAHRFSTVKASDYVIIMQDGRLVGFGTHEDLKENNLIYRTLFGFHSQSEQDETREVA